ncbi:solute carrier family 25 (mitochondrial thiamine pyrophosphate transporter), member 19 [Entomortierella parvispora]|uniref:Solute carrier family 25 (Mitochondrial thiamine pyrophosphate transporter), member 19 n=1 Tax=Entomortierella parvispora TaxID=205924 RepID=A0A9P3H9J2_9FUNG|nr:solute carrier family 25 (mitochondrial thiamine pyrophosphate transporter), member 19 [Entomortierella parvispora]
MAQPVIHPDPVSLSHSSSVTTTTTAPTTKRSTTNSDKPHDRQSIAAGAPNLTKIETVLCGSTAGVVSRFVIAPLDVVKIRLQIQTQRKDLPKVLRRKAAADILNASTDLHHARVDAKGDATMTRTGTPGSVQPKYKGMFSGMAMIAREEGIRGLWKGNMAAEYLYLTYGGIQFLVYQQTKLLLSKTADIAAQKVKSRSLTGSPSKAAPSQILTSIAGSSTVQSFISGATAGIMATACTYPFDLLRTRFAIQRDVKVYTGIIQAFQHIYKKDGIPGYYRGMAPALIQVIPYMGVMFGSYDTLKHAISWLKAKAQLEESKGGASSKSEASTKTMAQVLLGLEDMFCGAMSGVISKTAVYPLDMVRKRLQIQGSDQQKTNQGVFAAQPAINSNNTSVLKGTLPSAPAAAKGLPTTVWKCMVHIVKNEGYLALYKGLLPGILKAAPASAVTFLVFSQTGAFIERFRRPSQQSEK